MAKPTRGKTHISFDGGLVWMRHEHGEEGVSYSYSPAQAKLLAEQIADAAAEAYKQEQWETPFTVREEVEVF